MNLLDAVAQSQNGQGLNNLATQFGLTQEQTQQAVGALIPHLAAGLKNQGGGLGALVGMLGSGEHAQVAADPSQAFGSSGAALGNQVLGQIFGSKDVSASVANAAAQQSGVSSDVLHQMLPMVTTMVMGALANRAASAGGTAGAPGGGGLGGMLGGLIGGSGAGAAAGGGSPLTSMLSSVLDANHDGNVADDLMKMAGGFFSKR